MAKKVKGFPTLQRGSRYPWGEWLDGSVWMLTQGEDFSGTAEHFRAHVYSAAKVRGLAAKTSRTGDTLYIQAVPMKVTV